MSNNLPDCSCPSPSPSDLMDFQIWSFHLITSPSFHLKTLYHLFFSTKLSSYFLFPPNISSSLILSFFRLVLFYQPRDSSFWQLQRIFSVSCLSYTYLFPRQVIWKRGPIPAPSTLTPDSGFCLQCLPQRLMYKSPMSSECLAQWSFSTAPARHCWWLLSILSICNFHSPCSRSWLVLASFLSLFQWLSLLHAQHH